MELLEFQPFKRRMWRGTLIFDAVLLVGCALFFPDSLYYLTVGIVVGLIYLKSLLFTAEYPLRKLQIVFSLTRLLCFAYLISSIGSKSAWQFLVVMGGFLSYKGTLTAEYLIQALPAFRVGTAKSARG